VCAFSMFNLNRHVKMSSVPNPFVIVNYLICLMQVKDKLFSNDDVSASTVLTGLKGAS